MRWLAGLLVFIGLTFVLTSNTYADSMLGVQPLEYTESLQKGERKKAFIDVTNPSLQPVVAQFSVQGFKQIDDKGTLSFYDDPKLNEGILLDYQELEIPAQKTLRLFFIVDGTKLPTGDVFAAIFARTKPDQMGVAPSVRIGTLLILTNDTPGARQAEVVSFMIPAFNFGKAITGEVKIRNTASANTSSGFSPEVNIQLWPFGPNKTIAGPLVFAGNTRTIKLDLPSNQVGIYKMTASYETSQKTRWVVLVTGVWRWIVPIIFTVILAGFLLYRYRYSVRRRRRS